MIKNSNQAPGRPLYSALATPELWIVLLAAASRLLPHPPNFTAVGALALFSGASLRRPFILPLAAMLLSDTILGFHTLMPFVYGAFLVTVGAAWLLRAKSGVGLWAAIVVGSSLVFFGLTNLGVWLVTGLYPRTLAGLSECFVMALPFLRNSLVGDLFFTGLLFASLRLCRFLASPTSPGFSARL